MTFKLHTIDTAPDKSKPLLEDSVRSFSMIPNLHAVMAEAPNVLEAYQTLHKLFQNSSFDNDELTVVWQTINVEHNCHNCIPAHTGIAKMMKVDDAIIEALKNKTQLPSTKLQVLHEVTLSLIKHRGHLDKELRSVFYKVGYNNQQVLEVILGISQKVMSNYINHVSKIPVDKAFEKFV